MCYRSLFNIVPFTTDMSQVILSHSAPATPMVAGRLLAGWAVRPSSSDATGLVYFKYLGQSTASVLSVFYWLLFPGSGSAPWTVRRSSAFEAL